MQLQHLHNLALLGVSATTLLAGLVLYLLDERTLAQNVWLAGTLPVLATLLHDIAVALLHRRAGVDILALLSISLALLLGEFLTASVIALMLASGHTLEAYAEARARREMTALLSHAPRQANRYENGQWQPVILDQVRPGDRLLVRVGETVPVDGSLLGVAELDEAMLTGEAKPRHRLQGEPICSGVLNAGAAFEMMATTTAAESTFAGVVQLVTAAQQARSPTARLADRYAILFVPLTLAIAGTAWFASGEVMRLLAVLVVATPCPLILAAPVAIVSGMSRCARRGILIKSGGALERLAQAGSLFFDKTGTLTGGHARLTAIQTGPQLPAETVLQLAASLDQASNHVIAVAVVAAARERGLVLSAPEQVSEEPGAGLSGQVDGHAIRLGSYAYVTSATAPAPWCPAFLQRLGYEGASGVFVSVDGIMAGALQLADQIRLDTPRALRLLRQAGIGQIVMLTGDQHDVAETIGTVLGVSKVLAEQSPADKLAAIQLARRDGQVIMVGDGTNDAPALAAADVGVAMGARGTAASSEAADIVLLVDRLDRLAEALLTARRTRRIALQSMATGMALSLAAMVVAAFGFLPPLSGAVLQELIDVAAILNALRAGSGITPAPGTLPRATAERLKTEHGHLAPLLERLRIVADGLPELRGDIARAELISLNEMLRLQLLPHERQDDIELYPDLARLLGGDDPMAALSGTHREIFRITRLLAQITADLPAEGPSPANLRELQRLLYGLDTVLCLHFAQEEELYHVLSEPA